MIFKNFISIGPNCVIRSRIDYYLKNKGLDYGKTNFFDYSLCNSSSLVQLLRECDINYYFNLKNIEYKKTNDNNGFAHVCLKNVYFKSIHDVKNCENENEIKKELQKYIEKYKRRYYRLLSRIKSKENIVLIHMGEIENDQYEKIRKNLNFICDKKIPIICICDFEKNFYLEENDLFIKINCNINQYNIKTKTNWLWMDFINWNELFLTIEKFYIKFFSKKIF